MAKKKPLVIDADLYQATVTYVNHQIAVMARYGSAPVLTPAKFDALVYKIAAYPQKLRDWGKK